MRKTDIAASHIAAIHPPFLSEHRKGEHNNMSGEIFNAAFLASTLILVGLSLGFLLLKLQGGEE